MTCASTKKCSCEDKGLHTPCPVCNPVDCPSDPNPCAEVFCSNCIIYCGNDLPRLYIENGDHISDILQILATDDTDCKRMILGLHATAVTSTAIHVAWTNEEVVDAEVGDIEIQYSTDQAAWFANPAVNPPTNSDVIGNSLTPDTTYYIKAVITISEGVTCDSATIAVKTNPQT